MTEHLTASVSLATECHTVVLVMARKLIKTPFANEGLEMQAKALESSWSKYQQNIETFLPLSSIFVAMGWPVIHDDL